MDIDALRSELRQERDAQLPVSTLDAWSLVQRRAVRQNRRRASAVMASVAAVALVAVLGGVVTRSGEEVVGTTAEGREVPSVVSVPGGRAPQVTFGSLPATMRLTAFLGASQPDVVLPEVDVSVVVYAAPDADLGVDRSLAVVGLQGPGVSSSSGQRTIAGLTSYGSVQDGDRFFTVLGRAVTEDEGRALIDSLDPGRPETGPSATPPAGMVERLRRVALALDTTIGPFAAQGTERQLFRADPQRQTNDMVMASVTPEGAAWEEVARWQSGLTPRPPVAGRPAFGGRVLVGTSSSMAAIDQTSDASTPPATPARRDLYGALLTWTTPSGATVSLQALSPAVTEDELHAMAESLRPASDEEWAAIVAMVPSVVQDTLDPGCTKVNDVVTCQSVGSVVPAPTTTGG